VSDQLLHPDDIAIERYELRESAPYQFEFDRRQFLKVFSAMGGGLLVVASISETALDAQETGRGSQGRAVSGDLASWLHIDERGQITAYTGKVEIGQNIRTSLTQVVADELHVPLSRVSFVMADTALTPFDQGTFGSRTTPAMAPLLARAAATAREMLIDLAAARWQIDRGSIVIRSDGGIAAPDGRTVTFGELTQGRKLTGVVAANAQVAPADRWTERGSAALKVNGREIVTGRHQFTPDLVRPGMLFGHVIRPNAYGATAQTVDDAKARAMAGVTVVRDGNFIGVVAPTDRDAARAASAVNVQWQAGPSQPSSQTIYEHLKRTQTAGGGRGGAAGSDRPVAAAASAKTFETAYHIPYIAHVPLEPRAAVAEWSNGGVTVWCGTQRPFGVRTEVAQAFRLAEDQVRVIVPDMGSAYGGKHSGEHAIEAARLAKAADRPVKLVYGRPEEFSWGYFRPAGVIEIKAGVDAGGAITSWEFDNWNSGNSGLPTPYKVGAKREAFHQSDSPLRQGSYRGLAATANNYAREMHMDAIARALGVDPVEYRLRHLDNPRLRAVLTAAAQKAGWPRPSIQGRGLGIACGTEKGSYVAAVAEVSVGQGYGIQGRGFVLHRLVVVFECGAIVNPDGLHNQVEGAVVQGLGGALFEHVDFADGRLLNGTLAQYRVPRFKDVPAIEVVLLDRKDLPSAGAGETPIICVAPAIGSAVRQFGEVLPQLPVTLA
jgi:CO/xanthine dehydrogenase Mo-binding subunit